MAAWKKRWPLGRGFERFYGFLGGESSCWYPDLIHDNHPIEPPATPAEGYHIAKDLSDQAIRVHPGRQGRRAGQAVLPLLQPGCRARAAPRLQGVGRQVQGHLRRRLRGDPRPDPGPAEGARAAARRHRAERHQPARRARRHRPRRAALAAARHGAPLGVAERGREAPLHPDGRGVRRLRRVHRRPGRPGHRLPGVQSGELDNTIIVVVSDNGASGEGGPNGTFNEWRFFNGVPDPDRADAGAHRRARRPGVLQPLQHRLGLGVRHPVPVLEAVGGLRGRHRRHVPGVVAGQGRRRQPPCARSTSTRSTSCRRSTT